VRSSFAITGIDHDDYEVEAAAELEVRGHSGGPVFSTAEEDYSVYGVVRAKVAITQWRAIRACVVRQFLVDSQVVAPPQA
jgi:hypothetical protein